MDDLWQAAEKISLFCRLNLNTKRELPVRSSEMGMMIYLCKTEGEKTPMGIARFFQMSKAGATNMVTAMYKQGYIEKHISDDDRRSSLLVPTEKAKALVNSTYEEYHKTMWVLKEGMGDKEFSELLCLLERGNTILLEEKSNG